MNDPNWIKKDRIKEFEYWIGTKLANKAISNNLGCLKYNNPAEESIQYLIEKYEKAGLIF